MSEPKITVEKRSDGYDKLRIVDYGDHKVGEWQPGNATRYVCYVQKTKKPATELGIGESGLWLVAFPEFGPCYYILEGGFLDTSYMAEKFGKRRAGGQHNHVDLSEMAKLIARLVPGVQYQKGVTDDTGHETDEYRARRVASEA